MSWIGLLALAPASAAVSACAAADDDDASDSVVDDVLDECPLSLSPEELAAARCIAGVVVERLHDIPDDAPGDIEGPPMAGVTVREIRGTTTSASDADGVFRIAAEDPNCMAVIGGKEGFVSRAFIQTWASFEASGRGVEIDLPLGSHEVELYEEVFGIPWDDERAAVYIHFYSPDGLSLEGASAEFVSDAGPFVYLNTEDLIEGDAIVEHSPDPQVMFPGVEPGERLLAIESPAGLQCLAPAVVPVEAGVMTDVWVTCVPE